MKNLYQYIFESMDTLYHFTSVVGLLEYLKTNDWACSKNDYHNENGYDYYVSFSRNSNSNTGYPASLFSSNICRICVDGRMLGSRFQIKPITFFPTSKHRAIKSLCGVGDEYWSNEEWVKEMTINQQYVENEDRLYTKKDTIKNFSRYIDKIQVCEETCPENMLEEVKRLCEKWGITLEVIKTVKKFQTSH